MKTTLSTHEAANLLKTDPHANWSRGAAYALVEYLEQLEADTGTEMEFDRVALRCDFTEYDSALEAAEQYTIWCDTEEDALEYLQDHTTVIEFDGGVVIGNFTGCA